MRKWIIIFLLLFVTTCYGQEQRIFGDVADTYSRQMLYNKSLIKPKIEGGTINRNVINNSTIGATTPASGAFTTGSFSDDVTITDGILTINRTDTAGLLKIQRIDASPNDDDIVGNILFEGDDSIGTMTSYVILDGISVDITNDAEKGDFKIRNRNGAGYTTSVTVKADGSIIFGGGTIYTPSADQARANDSTITIANTIVRVAGDGGAAVLDTAPAIEDGSADGQMVIIQGTHDTNTVQIVDNVNTQLAGGVAITLGKGDTIQLIWDSGESDWYELNRADN